MLWQGYSNQHVILNTLLMTFSLFHGFYTMKKSQSSHILIRYILMSHYALPICIPHVFNKKNPVNETRGRHPQTHTAKLHRPNPKIHRHVLLMWPQTQLHSIVKHRKYATGAIESSCPSPNSIASFQMHINNSECLQDFRRDLQETLKGVGAALNWGWTSTSLLWL